MDLNQWAFIGVFLAIAGILPAAPIVLGWLLGPRKPNTIKTDTYECGVETVGDAWVQFKVQYYIFALVFLIFDVEMVFLFPWAVAYGNLGLFAFVEVLIFLALLAVALVYVWRKGALEWT
ncbi:MAG: NADH-quinone oxidoreductase subunit A [Anaerolineae bacterium]